MFVIKNVHGDEDIILITDHGTTIRTSLSQVSETGRNTVGVKIITLRNNEKLSSVSVLPADEEFDAKDEEIKEEAVKTDEDSALKELLKRAEKEGDGDSGDEQE